MQQGQKFLLATVALGLSLVLGACITYTDISTYNGIAHDANNRIWVTGSTTRYGNTTPLYTVKWIQVCTQDPMTTAPRLLCQQAQIIESVLPEPRPPADLDSGDPDQGDDDDEDEGEDEDEKRPAQPAPQGHPLNPK